MNVPTEKAFRKIATNRRAFRDYTIVERLEAGVALQGTEVKSIRAGQLGMIGSFAKVEKGQVVLCNLNIPPYDHGNRFNHEPDRPRALLLHKREIKRLQALVEQKGLTLIPLSLYYKHGKVKVEVGVCKGKANRDKRETLRRRTADREAERAMASRRGKP